VQGDSVEVSDTGLISAVGDGMSVIRITYDEIAVGFLDSLFKYNAVDPNCVGIVVVDVGDGDSGSFRTGITLTEHDTVYYDRKIISPSGEVEETGKSYAEYHFTPEAGSTVKVLPAPDTKDAVNGPWTEEWTDYQSDENGGYSVRLYDGKNIIRVEYNGAVRYHVIRASGVDVQIENTTSKGKELSVGDTARIHLEGLYLPVPKMAAVYNPGSFSYSGTFFPSIQYKIDGTIIRGNNKGQYNLRNTNELDVELDESGEITLSDGCINEPYMGDPAITHYNIPEEGLTRNFNAVSIGKTYSILPDIVLEVSEAKPLGGTGSRIKKLTSPVPKGNGTVPVEPNRIRMNYGDGDGDDLSKDISSGYIYEDELRQNSMVLGGGGSAFSLRGSCYEIPSEVLFRYWKEGAEEERFVESSNQQNFKFTGEALKLPSDAFENAELIIIPGSAEQEPYTYSFKVADRISVCNSNNVLPYLLNLEALLPEDDHIYGEHDGELKAAPVSYKDEAGEEKETDLGYGFLSTESRYSLTIPESLSEIAFDMVWFRQSRGGSNEYTAAKITVEGNDSYSQECRGPETGADNLTVTEPIPLNGTGDTVLHIKLTTTEKNLTHLSSEYIITVRKHPDLHKKKVTFHCEQEGTSIRVRHDGKTISPGKDGSYYLNDGEYDYTASCTGYSVLKGNFSVDTSTDEEQVIEVPLLDGTRKVTFHCATEGADIIVKDARKKQVLPEEGVFALIGGDTYTYYASCDGYYTAKVSFEVGDEAEQAIEVPELTQAPSIPRGSKVYVTVIGDEKRLINAYAVPMNISREEADLVTGKNYVEYNLGTYTALHALIYALEDDQGIDYTCRKGKLRVITELADDYPDGSWVCEVNGRPVADPSMCPVDPDDQILLYYDKGYKGMTHALFSDPVVEITEGEDVTLTLHGHVIGQGTDDDAVAGARIYVNQKRKGSTDAFGAITLSGLTMAGSPYVITAKKVNSDGENILTYNQCIVSVQSKTEEAAGGNTVRFRLIGDSKHGDDGHSSYQTWIATEEIPLSPGTDTVSDIFMKAVGCAGLKQEGAEEGYIRMVKGPDSLGGAELREFDNGSASGWMYTLNGIHPQLGVKEQVVKAGDVIVFHYVDNYHIEENNYTWLEAKDENPEGIRPYVIQNTLNLISGLPAASKISLKDKEAVEEAREAYDALTGEQKEQIDADTLKRLTDAEAKIAELTKAEEKKKADAATVAVKKGTKFTVKGYKYTVTSNLKKKPAVTVTGYKNRKLKKILISATVTYKKVTFKVTGVGKNAFKNQKKAVSVVIGKNVETIGACAFAGDSRVKKITVQSAGLKKVGAKALKGIYKKAKIKVPKKQFKAYKKLFKGKGQAKTVKILQ
jgi:signal peptidase I